MRQAHADATAWSQGVLTPLMHQIKEHRRQIDSRLQTLRKINESKGNISENIAALEAEIVPLRRQWDEIATISKILYPKQEVRQSRSVEDASRRQETRV